jgi:hypothetical protein
MSEATPAGAVSEVGRHPGGEPRGSCHLLRMGSMRWWGVTEPAPQHERDENLVHIGNRGQLQFDALSIFAGSRSQSTPEPAGGAAQPPCLAPLAAECAVA